MGSTAGNGEEEGETEEATRFRWRRVVIIGVLVALVLSALVVVPIVRGIYSPRLDEFPDSVDAVVVFAGQEERVRMAVAIMELGISPVLVVSYGDRDPLVGPLCDDDHSYEVWCVRPSPSNTRGEARLFGELAEANGWSSMLAVTANYHVERARTYLERCYDGELSFAGFPWRTFSNRALRHEILGSLQARYLTRGC